MKALALFLLGILVGLGLSAKLSGNTATARRQGAATILDARQVASQSGCREVCKIIDMNHGGQRHLLSVINCVGPKKPEPKPANRLPDGRMRVQR